MSDLPRNEEMQLDTFIRAPKERRYELINGKVRPLSIEVAGHVEARHALWSVLYPHAKENRLGETSQKLACVVIDNEMPELLRQAFIPDVCFITADRLRLYKDATPEWRERPLMIMPDLVAEVVSPDDRVSEFDEKIDAYLIEGVKLIWVIDPWRRKARIHSPDQENPIVLRGDAVLDADKVIPGFKVVLSKLFE